MSGPSKNFKSQFSRFPNFNPYELHKHLINHYVLTQKGSTALLKRDTSRDKRDIDVIRENHRFLWEDDEEPKTWEERLAKKYYEKLYKEFCICDLTYYKLNKFAMRWQTEPELIVGKGQFTCGARNCTIKEGLRTWEVNFAYMERGEKKNALVKLRLCEDCSKKLNYKHKRKEIKRLGEGLRDHEKGSPKKKKESEKEKSDSEESSSDEEDEEQQKAEEENAWKGPANLPDERSRDDEFQEYLEQLLL